MTLFTIFSVAVVSHFPSHESIRCSIYMGEPSQIQSESVYLFWGSLKELLHMLHWIFGYRFLNTWIVLTAEKPADKSPSGLGINLSEDFRPPPDPAQYRASGIHPLCCLIPLPEARKEERQAPASTPHFTWRRARSTHPWRYYSWLRITRWKSQSKDLAVLKFSLNWAKFIKANILLRSNLALHGGNKQVTPHMHHMDFVCQNTEECYCDLYRKRFQKNHKNTNRKLGSYAEEHHTHTQGNEDNFSKKDFIQMISQNRTLSITRAAMA